MKAFDVVGFALDGAAYCGDCLDTAVELGGSVIFADDLDGEPLSCDSCGEDLIAAFTGTVVEPAPAGKGEDDELPF